MVSTAMTLLMACAALCTSCTGERVIAHVDQPHRVEIIRDTRIVSGGWHVALPLPAQHTSCFVRVYLDEICEIAIPCESPASALRAYPSQSLVVFRVGDPWHAIRFVGSRAFYDCRPSLGNGSAPDLQHLDSLADAADRILSCEQSTGLFEETKNITSPSPGWGFSSRPHAIWGRCPSGSGSASPGGTTPRTNPMPHRANTAKVCEVSPARAT